MTWPTLRLLTSLKNGWTDKHHEALVARNAWSELPSFDKLGHPAIQVCQDFADNPGSNKYEEHKASTRTAGYKVIEARDSSKGPAWRTAMINMLGTTWAVFADTHDKFHASAPNAFKRKKYVEPDDDDVAIRKLKLGEAETYEAIENWQRDMVRTMLDIFRDAYILEGPEGGEVTEPIPEPPVNLFPEGASSLNASITLTVMRDSDEDCSFDDAHEEQDDAIELGISFDPWKVDEVLKDLILSTVLPVIDPDEERWTKDAGYYGKNGDLCFSYYISVARASQLIYSAESDGQVDEAPKEPQATQFAHYVVRNEVVASVVEKRAIRSVCGFWFVTSRVPDGFPICEECADALPDASAVHTFLKQRTSGSA
jgi:hypothetical protein